MSDKSSQQALFIAVERGDVREMERLIQRGADVDGRRDDPDGETPLMRAVTSNQSEAAKILLKAGANPNAAGLMEGRTPLMFALESPAMLKVLIEARADLNAQTMVREFVSPVSGRKMNRGGETALHLAAAANNAEAIRILAEAGADIELKSGAGVAPLDLAFKLGSPTAASVALVEAGAKLTPERLEAVHSGAHEPDSPLQFFPEIGELPPSLPGPEAANASMIVEKELRCPECNDLVYSMKVRVCGRCGAELPLELWGDKEQRRVRAERARQIADTICDAETPPSPWRRQLWFWAIVCFVLLSGVLLVYFTTGWDLSKGAIALICLAALNWLRIWLFGPTRREWRD